MGIYDRPYYREARRPTFWLASQSMVVTLIIINVAVWLVDSIIFGRQDNPWRASRLLAPTPDTLLKPWLWWQFLTCGFVHSYRNVGHILCNMLALYFLGQDVERTYGSRLFLRMYLTAIVVCSFVWSLTEQLLGHENARLIGASGAITAVIILFSLNFPRRTILLMMFLPMPAWLFGLLLVIYNILGVQADTIGSERIAYDVHLTGAAYALLFFRTQWAFGGWPSSMRWPGLGSLRRRSRLRVHEPDARQETIDQQADAILEKLHREGQASLSARERKILEDYSRRMQQKRR